MYYILVEQKFHNNKRVIITMINKEAYVDMIDNYFGAIPPVKVLNHEVFESMLKNGFETEEAALKNEKTIQEIVDNAGIFCNCYAEIVDEYHLSLLYNMALENSQIFEKMNEDDNLDISNEKE